MGNNQVEHSEVLARLAKEVGVWSDELAEPILLALTSPTGRHVLRTMVNEAATVSTVRLNTDFSNRLYCVVGKDEFKIKRELEPVINIIKNKFKLNQNIVNENSSKMNAGDMLRSATELLKSVSGRGVIPAQVLEILDNVKMWSPAQFGMSNLSQGVIAAATIFAMSAVANSDRYRQGHIRWDDAVDATIGDTVKAGFTGLALSAIAGGLSVLITPQIALAASILLAPMVHAIVGKLVDFLFLKVLGGDAIIEARNLHREYLHESAFMKRELWTRIRRLHQIGGLVERLNAFSQSESSTAKVNAEIYASAKVAFELFSNSSKTNQISENFARFYEERLFRYLGAETDCNLYVNGREPLISFDEIKMFEREVYDIFWNRYSLDSGYRKISLTEIQEQLVHQHQINTLSAAKREFILKFIKYLYSLERERNGRPEAPLRYWTVWYDENKKTQKFYINATFPSEFIHIVLALEQAKSWPWESGLRQSYLKSYSVKDSAKIENILNFKVAIDSDPSTHEEFNKYYAKDLYESLRTGKYRLFSYGNQKGWPTYIAAPSSEDTPEEQCEILKFSLQKYHPRFANGDLLYNMQVVDVNKLIANDKDYHFMLTCLGLRVLVVDMYTATFRVAEPDDLRNVRVIVQDAYFCSLEEAQLAFKNLTNVTLVAVRPGPRVIGDTLRKRAQAWRNEPDKRESLFALQNELLGRLGEGMILLDQLANESEARIARLAGMGVFLSWWWSLTGRTRRELIVCLKDAKAQQSLRMELMSALLEVQRLHILSHAFFDEKLCSVEARLDESKALEASSAVTLNSCPVK